MSDEGFGGEGFNYDSLVSDSGGSGGMAAGGEGQPPTVETAPDGQQQQTPGTDYDDNWWEQHEKNDVFWEKLAARQRVSEAFRQQIQARDSEWLGLADRLGLREEFQKRYQALQANNPYWTKQQAEQVARQQTAAAHQQQPGQQQGNSVVAQLQSQIGVLTRYMQNQMNQQRQREAQETQQRLESDIVDGIRAAKVGNAEDTGFQSIMRTNMLALARVDLDKGRSIRPMSDYAKEAYAQITRHFGVPGPRVVGQTTIPPTGVQPGVTQAQNRQAIEEELTRRLVTES